jgi:hypothetical protein
MSDDPTITTTSEQPKPKTARERLADLDALEQAEAIAAKEAAAEAAAEKEIENRAIVARLKKEHPGEELRRVDIAHVGMFICGRASSQQYRNFRKDSFDEAKRADAQEYLVLGGTLYPGPDQVERAMVDFPGITSELANVIDELSGGKAEAKKV